MRLFGINKTYIFLELEGDHNIDPYFKTVNKEIKNNFFLNGYTLNFKHNHFLVVLSSPFELFLNFLFMLGSVLSLGFFFYTGNINSFYFMLLAAGRIVINPFMFYTSLRLGLRKYGYKGSIKRLSTEDFIDFLIWCK